MDNSATYQKNDNNKNRKEQSRKEDVKPVDGFGMMQDGGKNNVTSRNTYPEHRNYFVPVSSPL